MVQQDVAQIRQCGFLAWALPMQQRLRIGRRGVRIIAPTLPMEVDGGIPGVIGRLARLRIPLLKALQAGPGLQLRPIHREVFVREQAGCPGLRPDGVEERGGHIARQQPVPGSW